MSEIRHLPLAVHFEPRLLSELGVLPLGLLMTTSHQPTLLAKSGLKGLLAKLPFGDDTPVPIDIDVSCGLYNDKGELLEAVWYGNLRSQGESVRHHGDTFIGMNKAYRPSLVEENLSIRLHELPKEVHRLALFVHSKGGEPLAKAVAGMVYLKDGEGRVIHERSFASLDKAATGICAWQMVRSEGDWRVSAPMSVLKAANAGEMPKKWHGLGN